MKKSLFTTAAAAIIALSTAGTADAAFVGTGVTEIETSAADGSVIKFTPGVTTAEQLYASLDAATQERVNFLVQENFTSEQFSSFDTFTQASIINSYAASQTETSLLQSIFGSSAIINPDIFPPEPNPFPGGLEFTPLTTATAQLLLDGLSPAAIVANATTFAAANPGDPTAAAVQAAITATAGQTPIQQATAILNAFGETNGESFVTGYIRAVAAGAGAGTVLGPITQATVAGLVTGLTAPLTTANIATVQAAIAAFVAQAPAAGITLTAAQTTALATPGVGGQTIPVLTTQLQALQGVLGDGQTAVEDFVDNALAAANNLATTNAINAVTPALNFANVNFTQVVPPSNTFAFLVAGLGAVPASDIGTLISEDLLINGKVAPGVGGATPATRLALGNRILALAATKNNLTAASQTAALGAGPGGTSFASLSTVLQTINNYGAMFGYVGTDNIALA